MGTKDRDSSNYRIKITDNQGLSTFIIRKNGRVDYLSASETPLALSNLLSNKAAETRFMLEDAFSGSVAGRELRKVLGVIWSQNMLLCPKVELLP